MNKKSIITTFFIFGFISTFVLFLTPNTLHCSQKYIVAVLDFHSNVNEISEDAMLQTGTADSVISDLMEISDFQVIERSRLKVINKELAYQHSGMIDEATAQEIGKQIGAEYLIYGSWQKAGLNYRINARLVRVKTGEIITSIKETDSNVFTLQDRIVSKIISTLNINISSGALARIQTPETSSIKAYKEFSQGLKANDRGDQNSVQSHMKRAVQIDPNYEKPKKYILFKAEYGDYIWKAKSAGALRLQNGLLAGGVLGGIGALLLAKKDDIPAGTGFAVGFGIGFIGWLTMKLTKVGTSDSVIHNIGIIFDPKTKNYGIALNCKF